MTRVKKNRSLKRIHKVKTGNAAKLKRQAGADRQVGKRVKGRRVLSAYEKFLLDNPNASEAAKAEQKAAERSALERKAAKEHLPEAAQEEREERPKSLLDQLDQTSLRDIY